jgi:hypothetical protein
MTKVKEKVKFIRITITEEREGTEVHEADIIGECQQLGI